MSDPSHQAWVAPALDALGLKGPPKTPPVDFVVPHTAGMKSRANDVQVGGEHYKKLAIQPWDYIAANNLGWFEGSVVKYVTRFRDKGGIDDLRKAMHILQKLIETEEKK
jgi:hypothetical protein